MTSKKRLTRVTISVDEDDYAAMGELATKTEISASWLIRQAIRDFLDKYGEHGQPELALRIANKRTTGSYGN
jgi:hypothetical protein